MRCLDNVMKQYHRIRIHRRATRVGAFEVFEAAHVALRTLLAFSQPVNCIFWPIGMLNWLVAASKLHKHRVTCCTAEWPFYVFLFYGNTTNIHEYIKLLKWVDAKCPTYSKLISCREQKNIRRQSNSKELR